MAKLRRQGRGGRVKTIWLGPLPRDWSYKQDAVRAVGQPWISFKRMETPIFGFQFWAAFHGKKVLMRDGSEMNTEAIYVDGDCLIGERGNTFPEQESKYFTKWSKAMADRNQSVEP